MSNLDKKTDWSQLESRIRKTLHNCYEKNITLLEAIDLIDDAINEETQRGSEKTSKKLYGDLEKKLLSDPLFFHEGSFERHGTISGRANWSNQKGQY